MAPPSLALAGRHLYSSGSLSPASSSRLEARQGALGWWDEASRFRYDSVHDEGGRFNGTCEDSELTLPPQPQRGYCASYYPDVSTYCCGAVGGILATDEQQTDADAVQSSSTSGSSTASATSSSIPPSDPETTMISEPSCMTTNYADMLDCYRSTTEQHCKGASNGPFGVCNAYGADTSRSVSSSSSGAAARARRSWKDKAAIGLAFAVALAGAVVSGGI